MARPIIVIVGVDGAGKSTIADCLAGHLKSGGEVARMSAGKPQPVWLETLRVRLRGGKASGQRSLRVGVKRSRVFRDAIPAVLLAWLRCRLTRRAGRMADRGTYVVSDRWPTLQHGRMDGPRIDVAGSGVKRRVLAWLQWLELEIYRRVERADLAFFLVVDAETAVQRNAGRDKEGKETKEDIVRRHRENLDLQPMARRIERVRNDGTPEEVVGYIKSRIAADDEGSRCAGTALH